MCTCDNFKSTQIRTRSVRKRFPEFTDFVITRKVIDGGLVAHVSGRARDGEGRLSTVICGADLVWMQKGVKTPGGVKYVVPVYRDTHKCIRKAVFAKEVRRKTAVALEAMFDDPEAVILEVFARVRRGEYVGEREGGLLYVQHLAEMMRQSYGVFDGIPLASTYMEFTDRKASVHDLGVAALHCDIPISHFSSLDDEEVRICAFFVDTLSIVQGLVRENKIGLSGMVLTRPAPPDVLDSSRAPLTAADPMLLFVLGHENLLFQVQRKFAGGATVCVFEVSGGGDAALLSTLSVGLLYGAQFGLDIEDVTRFERMFDRFIKTGELSEGVS